MMCRTQFASSEMAQALEEVEMVQDRMGTKLCWAEV